ncbi:efflux RND transporter periplasmic adaptor subunit [Vitiosangium sp. GDMCC 1.1324]|uniref:efflux RND transporter periplasmic adaptor subunit n=1 Tax=Vitiosangium sp. (strain GDMCC 1.1324) TaxID=2138576 RepID=UPI000D391B7A|nr:efflux RND transporter periplasmic adaptor subunit [Vitiosangium sp. GDMCC 1.1324]PTL76295.1 efflux RND transporter periplasmic adaptor subunit [Vitiosangium sp. GDMCC 1.1324]
MRRWVRMTAVGWGLACLGSVGASAPALANPDVSGNGPPPAPVVDGGAVSRPGTEEPFLGVIIPNDSVNVSSRFDSRLDRLEVEVGQSVHAGQVLARLDTRSLQQQLSAAEATLQGSRAEEQAASLALSEARAKKGRYFTPRSLELGVYSQEELDKVRYEESTANARLQAARATTLERQAQAAELRQNLGDATLVAPFDGVVAAKLSSPGSRLPAGAPVLKLLGTGGWKVRFAVPEEQARELQPGSSLEVNVLQRDLSLQGQVESVAPEVDSAARLVFATATFNQPPPPEVSSGMVVHVRPGPTQQLGAQGKGGSAPTGATP